MKPVYTVIEDEHTFSTFDAGDVERYLFQTVGEKNVNGIHFRDELNFGRVTTFNGNDRKVDVALSMIFT